MMGRLIFCAILALAMPASALAQASTISVEQRFSAAEMHETGLDTLTPAQLAALNRLLREKPAMPGAVQTPSSAQAGEAPGHQYYMGLDDKPIHSRVKGNVDGWEPDTVFELENGQRWKVLKGSMKLRAPLQAPEIIVVPGIAGRWFLQVDEDLPKARVYRID